MNGQGQLPSYMLLFFILLPLISNAPRLLREK